MSSLINRLNETVAFIRNAYSSVPEVGIILGSGLGNFLKEIKIGASINYTDLPHFPHSTVDGHAGKLVFGTIGNKEVVVMAGRFHYYEGYEAKDVGYPVQVMKFLGVQTLLISNAAGSVNTSFKPGDLMMINDHISMAIVNPLIGKNEESLGPRFPDMSEPYSKELIRKGRSIGEELNISLQEGVYFGVTGPTFETRAEYKMIRVLGADAVGMSTLQEVIVARHLGLPVFAISIIANMGIQGEGTAITHQEVLDAAGRAEPKLAEFFKQLIVKL